MPGFFVFGTFRHNYFKDFCPETCCYKRFKDKYHLSLRREESALATGLEAVFCSFLFF